MTALRRTPREVYRVYGQDEFLARVAEDRDVEPAAPSNAQRLLHRVAGTAMLLAAAGMVGGLVALTSLSSGTGARRRIVAGLLAAGGSRGAQAPRSARLAPAEVWREAAGARGSYRRGARERTTGRVRTPRRAAQPARLLPARSEPHVMPADRAVPVADEVQARIAPIDAVASTGATAPASQPQRSGQSEFGFER